MQEHTTAHNEPGPDRNTKSGEIQKVGAVPESSEDALKTLLKSFKDYSKENLEVIRDRADSLIKRRKKAERKNAIQEIKENMKKYEVTPEELAD